MFQIAHADRSACVLGQSLGALGANSQGTTPPPTLPPYPLDAASSSQSARAAALDATARETEYIDAAKACVGGNKSQKILNLEKQTALFAQRAWQMAAHTHSLEKARAVGRCELYQAQLVGIKVRRGKVSSSPGDGSVPLTAFEVRLATDVNARRRTQSAMHSVLIVKDLRDVCIDMSKTFWAWMKSVLELEEKEDTLGGSSGDDANFAETKESTVVTTESNHGNEEESPSSSGYQTSRSTVTSLTDEVEVLARKIGPLLRSRRRDVETVAKRWRLEREASATDPDVATALKILAKDASSKLPGMGGFEAGARGKIAGKLTSAKLGDQKHSGTTTGGGKDAPVGSSHDGDTENAACSLSKFFQTKCVLSLSQNASRVTPVGVVDLLTKSGACVRLDTGVFFSEDTATQAPTQELTQEVTHQKRSDSTWFGETNRGENRKRSFDARETSEGAVARLGVTLRETDAMLRAVRTCAAELLQTEVTRAFGANDETGGFVCHGWDR